MVTRTAVGYMRPANGDGASLDSAMREYAEAHGYVLLGVFVEDFDSANSGFSHLMNRLETLDDAVVIVPNLGHLASMKSLQEAVRQVIEDRHTLVVMYPATSQTS
ncbi:recombinase family protein [Streptomonospora sp. PA3]|uniref:recombinase family protein n=1 Tax=Streptomonospora sp. PA3 TaxID=2607326 RepID=UPI0012DDAB1C|nr:recombinase family protein [Streptomonospora sp. PA3]MUL41581.1 recombinase family protein [Streptomonospora sp. PA3]